LTSFDFRLLQQYPRNTGHCRQDQPCRKCALTDVERITSSAQASKFGGRVSTDTIRHCHPCRKPVDQLKAAQQTEAPIDADQFESCCDRYFSVRLSRAPDLILGDAVSAGYLCIRRLRQGSALDVATAGPTLDRSNIASGRADRRHFFQSPCNKRCPIKPDLSANFSQSNSFGQIIHRDSKIVLRFTLDCRRVGSRARFGSGPIAGRYDRPAISASLCAAIASEDRGRSGKTAIPHHRDWRGIPLSSRGGCDLPTCVSGGQKGPIDPDGLGIG
jgi:hypothetical protein